MKNLAVARRYAKALLLVGKEDDRVDVYGDELSFFADILKREGDFSQVLVNPLHSENDRREILSAVLKKLNLSKTITSFFFLLFDKKRVSFMEHINSFYQKFADELRGIARARLVSATTLSSDIIERIRVAVSKRIDKKVVLEVEHDSALIGGVVVTVGDLVLDGSVKMQLRNVRESFK